MPAPSQLAIATGAVTRLLKEEISYQKELVEQEAKVKVLEAKLKSGVDDEEGNAEYLLKQQKMVVEQTQSVFAPLKDRIAAAVTKLEDLVVAEEKTGGATPAELDLAKAALAQAKG